MARTVRVVPDSRNINQTTERNIFLPTRRPIKLWWHDLEKNDLNCHHSLFTRCPLIQLRCSRDFLAAVAALLHTRTKDRHASGRFIYYTVRILMHSPIKLQFYIEQTALCWESILEFVCLSVCLAAWGDKSSELTLKIVRRFLSSPGAIPNLFFLQ